MTPIELNSKIVTDVVEIYDSMQLWPETIKSRAQKLSRIKSALNSRHEEDIASLIASSSQSVRRTYLSQNYLDSVIRLLSYRSSIKTEDLPPIEIPESETHPLSSELINQLAADLQDPGDATIANYHLVSDAGSPENLESILTEKLKLPVTVEVTIPHENMGYRERVLFAGKKVWTIFPTLPILKISVGD